MKLHYWGTAAAEGIPAVFCQCKNCRRSAEFGGKNIRYRSQAVIDDKLLIDFGPDSMANARRAGASLIDFHHLLVTHAHGDHFYFDELINRKVGFAHFEGEGHRLTVYGSSAVTDRVQHLIDQSSAYADRLAVHTLKPFESVTIENTYTVTALPAVHAAYTGPFVYQISAGGQTMLYGHDSGIFEENVWEFWKQNGTVFDYVSLDCTAACTHIDYSSHMNLERNIIVRDRMLANGIANEKTVFCCNHFSHNGKHSPYDEFEPIAKKEGFITSFDGMQVEI